MVVSVLCCGACTGGLGVFARLLLQSSPAFLQLLARAEPTLAQLAVPAGGQPGERALLALVELWLDRFDNIGVPHARKLSALAMCVLLTVPLSALLECLEPLAGCITSVWFEVLLSIALTVRLQFHLSWPFYNGSGLGQYKKLSGVAG